MQEPLTSDLLERLLQSSDPVQFAEEYGITERNLPDYLAQLLNEKGLRRPDVVREAQIGETYGYYIFTGQRRPTRNFVIRLALAMHCTLVETNRLLQAAGLNALYCKNRRDVIIIFGIDHGFSLQRIDEQLYRFGEKTLQDEAQTLRDKADVLQSEAPSEEAPNTYGSQKSQGHKTAHHTLPDETPSSHAALENDLLPASESITTQDGESNRSSNTSNFAKE